MKLAAACYPIDWIWGYLGLVEKYDAWVSEAVAEGADLLVFPEYGAMELAALAGEATAGNLTRSMRAVSDLLPDYWQMCAELARRHDVHILTGSGPCRAGGAWVNRAMFVTPSGGRQRNDKQMLTPWERDTMGLTPGDRLFLMDTALGRIGVLIGCDAAVPMFAGPLVEAGADILLIPTQTAAWEAYDRIRSAAMARALDGRCVTVLAVTHGRAGWNPVLAENAGAAGVYAPPEDGLPAAAVTTEEDTNQPGWTFGTVDLEAIRRRRSDGAAPSGADDAVGVPEASEVQTITLA